MKIKPKDWLKLSWSNRQRLIDEAANKSWEKRAKGFLRGSQQGKEKSR